MRFEKWLKILKKAFEKYVDIHIAFFLPYVRCILWLITLTL